MKTNVERLPEDVLGAIRQNLGAEDENDIRFDVDINRMSCVQLFGSWCDWEGLLGSYHHSITEAIFAIYNTLGEDINEEIYEESSHKVATASFQCTNCGTEVVVSLGTPTTCPCGTVYNIDARIYRERNT